MFFSKFSFFHIFKFKKRLKNVTVSLISKNGSGGAGQKRIWSHGDLFRDFLNFVKKKNDMSFISLDDVGLFLTKKQNRQSQIFGESIKEIAFGIEKIDFGTENKFRYIFGTESIIFGTENHI